MNITTHIALSSNARWLTVRIALLQAFSFMAIDCYGNALLAAAPPVAPLSLSQPINCTLGDTCYVRQYVNVGQERGKPCDYRGGPLTSTHQKGTDFSLQTYQQIIAGVAVLAPAAGTVSAIKTDMYDQHDKTEEGSRRQRHINKKDYCGNYVVIDHGQGWTTRMCHLRQHSIQVAPGQAVRRGQVLGYVGSSGKTDGPYLHFQLRYNGAVVDPFQNQLWDPAIPYRGTGIIDKGISSTVPTLQRVQRKAPHRTSLTPLDPSMVAWIRLYGVRGGDMQRFIFIQPDGLTYGKPIVNTIDKAYKEWFSYGGYPIEKSFTNGLLGHWTVLYQMAHPRENQQKVQWTTIATYRFTMTTDESKSTISPIKP